MSCSNIIDCLRAIGINPTATATGSVNTEYTIDYTDHSNFHSGKSGKWVLIDFKSTVSIHSYQFHSSSNCVSGSWISEWNISVSFDNTSWVIADSPPIQCAGDKIFNLNKTVNARYLKIDGRAPLYSSSYVGFGFYYIKFYGSIIPISNSVCYQMTCKHKDNRINVNLMRIVFLLCYS
jgi:hypothetical protein